MRSLGYSTVLPGVRWCEQPFFHLIEGILSPDFNFKDAIETHSSGLLKDFQKLSFVSAKTARSLKDTLIVLPSFSPCCAQHFSHLAPRSRIGLALVLSVVRVAFRGASTEDDNDWLQIQTHISWTGHAKKNPKEKQPLVENGHSFQSFAAQQVRTDLYATSNDHLTRFSLIQTLSPDSCFDPVRTWADLSNSQSLAVWKRVTFARLPWIWLLCTRNEAGAVKGSRGRRLATISDQFPPQRICHPKQRK